MPEEQARLDCNDQLNDKIRLPVLLTYPYAECGDDFCSNLASGRLLLKRVYWPGVDLLVYEENKKGACLCVCLSAVGNLA